MRRARCFDHRTRAPIHVGGKDPRCANYAAVGRSGMGSGAGGHGMRTWHRGHLTCSPRASVHTIGSPGPCNPMCLRITVPHPGVGHINRASMSTLDCEFSMVCAMLNRSQTSANWTATQSIVGAVQHLHSDKRYRRCSFGEHFGADRSRARCAGCVAPSSCLLPVRGCGRCDASTRCGRPALIASFASR